MERAQLLLLGLPIFLFCTDLLNLFSAPPPSKPSSAAAAASHHHHVPPQPTNLQQQQPQTLDFLSEVQHRLMLELGPAPSSTSISAPLALTGLVLLGLQVGRRIHVPRGAPPQWGKESPLFAPCGARHGARRGRGTAMTMKKMLETSYSGVDVILANYPPSFPKRVVSKLIPVFQIGVMGIVIAGEHIFPRLGFIAPPPWYFSMRQNRFGTIATTWLLGNMLQSFLQSSGAFEVYCNGELVFSKLKEQRFPSEFELRELIGKRLGNSKVMW
ncbi:hypothetical protein Scep_005669 [Stephania cephalantha]|uniref:Selenoprotein T n=1 Tax=Stephania cephalantha TaxID=152367 RepID=A0AAP0KVP7_9MAGN